MEPAGRAYFHEAGTKAGSGKYSGKCELAPTAEQKKALEQLSKEHRIYVLGAQSAAYKSLLPEAVILDGYVKKELYLQSAAWEFFGAFEGYVGNQALEYDALERICKTFGVKEDIP